MHWLFMTLVASAYVCAMASPVRDRRAASSVMTVLLLTWGLYLLAWSDYPPAALFWAFGFPLQSEHLWALTDTVAATFVLAAAWQRWWGWVIFGALTFQQGFHASYDVGAISFQQLSRALDATFLIQLACFFVIGGSGVVDRLSRVVRVPGHLLHPPSSALRAKE